MDSKCSVTKGTLEMMENHFLDKIWRSQEGEIRLCWSLIMDMNMNIHQPLLMKEFLHSLLERWLDWARLYFIMGLAVRNVNMEPPYSHFSHGAMEDSVYVP